MKTNKTRKLGKIGVVVVAFIVCALVVRAAYLTHYGEMKTTGNFKQAIVFDGLDDNSPIEHTFTAVAGSGQCYKEKIRNRNLEVDGSVTFETTILPDDEGVTATIYQVPQITTLALNNKDSEWNEIDDDGIEGLLVFETVKTTFDYSIAAIGLTPDTDYSLIYYADPWAGNNPGALIGEFTSDGSGAITTTGSTDLGMNLPHVDDDNHLLGAKLWLVLSADYDDTTNEMIAWNMDDYLFEHELVSYSDCNVEVPCWLASLLGEPIVGELVVPAGNYVQLIFCYQSAIYLEGNTYSFSTLAIPVME